jgi:hypothetical protein
LGETPTQVLLRSLNYFYLYEHPSLELMDISKGDTHAIEG